MKTYFYDGPVMKFDICVQNHWQAQTMAETKRKAKSNLVFRWKMENNLATNARVSLPGKLTVREETM